VPQVRDDAVTDRGDWERERGELLGRRVSDLGLRIQGSPLESLVEQLYRELEARGLRFRPPVYLSDEWGCPSDIPVIGVPFYLADSRLSRLEAEAAEEVEGEVDAMKFLRHEAGHAVNYAYRLYDRPEWRRIFGPYSRPYRDRFHVDPFSREHVRHILGWYAQKHPDEDFAETFAVWLTPGLDWRSEYAGWGALRKLEAVDVLMAEVSAMPVPDPTVPGPEHLSLDALTYTVGEYYGEPVTLPLASESHFDGDLGTLFVPADQAPAGESAGEFMRRHRREIVSRIAYWTGEPAVVVKALVEFLAARAEALELRVGRLEAATLIELTAFGTAVIMNYRYTNHLSERGAGE
jgi:hypothetical protein